MMVSELQMHDSDGRFVPPNLQDYTWLALGVGGAGNIKGFMDQNSNSTEGVEYSQNTQNKKPKRGPTKLTLSGARSKGRKKKINIELNSKGQPCGPTRALTSSDYGRLCRSYIPINTLNAGKLDSSVKSKILMDIQENFVCDNTKNWQTKMLQRVTNRLRGWKNYMYSNYILPNLSSLHEIAKPPSKYTTITADQWTDFVMERTSPNWEVVRKNAQDTQSKNKYLHRLSRKGYAGLEEELQEKKGSSDPIPRHELWKEGRCVDGEYLDNSVKEKADEIDDIARQVEEGTLEVSGIDDVLTQALGTSEHCGRVRGVGTSVTSTVYFKNPRRISAPKDAALLELQQFMRLLAGEVQRLGGDVPNVIESQIKAAAIGSSKSSNYRVVSPDLNSQGIECPPCEQPSPMVDTTNENRKKLGEGSPPSFPDRQLLNGEKSCLLALGSIDCIIVRGILTDGLIVHGVVLGEGYARVNITGLQDQRYSSLPLPIPTEDATTVGVAVGGFIAWPKSYIIVNTATVHSPQITRAEERKLAITAFKTFVDKSTNGSKNKAFMIELLGGVFRNIDPSYISMTETHVVRSDLIDLIEFGRVEYALIRVYMGALYKNSMEHGLEEKFAFVLPSGVAGYPSEVNSMHLYDCLGTSNPNMIFFYPFNIGCHWVLCVIDPWKRLLFYFDPLSYEMVPSVKEVLENAPDSRATMNVDFMY